MPTSGESVCMCVWCAHYCSVAIAINIGYTVSAMII